MDYQLGVNLTSTLSTKPAQKQAGGRASECFQKYFETDARLLIRGHELIVAPVSTVGHQLGGKA